MKMFAKAYLAYSLALDNKGFEFTPYYMEGSKGQPNYIRTTENVSALFQDKLCKKWEQDKAKGRNPKWTNRDVPEFYEKWLKEKQND